MRLMREAAREDGWEKGLLEGASQKLKEQIAKKLAKGSTLEEISELLEEPIERIQTLASELSKRTSV